MLAGGEAFDRHPQIGAKRGLRRIETREEIALERGREEALR
jgi:hypothetical protein